MTEKVVSRDRNLSSKTKSWAAQVALLEAAAFRRFAKLSTFKFIGGRGISKLRLGMRPPGVRGCATLTRPERSKVRGGDSSPSEPESS